MIDLSALEKYLLAKNEIKPFAAFKISWHDYKNIRKKCRELRISATFIDSAGMLKYIKTDLNYHENLVIYENRGINIFNQYAFRLNDIILQGNRKLIFLSAFDKTEYSFHIIPEFLHKDLKSLLNELYLEQFSNLIQGKQDYSDNISIIENRYKNIEETVLKDQNQRAAIEHIHGPVRLLAPAGSGKTKTLINRIIFLINNGVRPENILALAFNKKAAREMRERLQKKNIPVSRSLKTQGVLITTFHALGYDVIKSNLGWKYDENNEYKQYRRLLYQAVNKHHNIKPQRNTDVMDFFALNISRIKMDLMPVNEMLFGYEDDKEIDFKDIFNTYLKIKSQHKLINFDDMVYLSVRIILKNGSLRRKLQNRFRFVLVDEFQDLNYVQLLLTQVLAMPQNNLFIVGDDDQMIYGWRGAQVRFILDFEKNYSNANSYILETNYRSRKKIITHSRWLIDHNQKRIRKNIRPSCGIANGSLEYVLEDNLKGQAIRAIKWMINLKKEKNYQWHDFAFLFRFHAYQFALAFYLDQFKIKHNPVNPERLFLTTTGQDIYSYLTLLLYPDKTHSNDIKRVLKRPNKYLLNDQINGINSYKQLLNTNLNQANKYQRRAFAKFKRELKEVQNQLKYYRDNPSSFIQYFCEQFGIIAFYREQKSLITEVDQSNNEIILNVIITIAESFQSIADFYNYMSLNSGEEKMRKKNERLNENNKVILTTIHSTKGNEYKNVIYFNLCDECELNSDIEEERRVCYVGMTRAIDNLLITAPKQRYAGFLKEALMNPDFKNRSLKKLKRSLYLIKRKQYNSKSADSLELEIKIRESLNLT